MVVSRMPSILVGCLWDDCGHVLQMGTVGETTPKLLPYFGNVGDADVDVSLRNLAIDPSLAVSGTIVVKSLERGRLGKCPLSHLPVFGTSWDGDAYPFDLGFDPSQNDLISFTYLGRGIVVIFLYSLKISPRK